MSSGNRGTYPAASAEVLPDDGLHEYMNDANLRQQRPMLPPREPTLQRNSTLNTVSGGNAAASDQAYLRRDNDLDQTDDVDDERGYDRRQTNLDDYEAEGGKVTVEPPAYIIPGSKPKEAFPRGVVIGLVVAVIVIVLIVIGTVITLIILFSRSYNKPYSYYGGNNNNGYGYYQNNQGQGMMNPNGMAGQGGFGSMYGNGMGMGMPGSGMAGMGGMTPGGVNGFGGMGGMAGRQGNYQ